MMHEIECRGKQLTSGDWVYGFPFIEKSKNFIVKPGYTYDQETQFIEIMPETLCQFTGCFAKKSYLGRREHDLRIFNRDIVRYGNLNRMTEPDVNLGVVIKESGCFFINEEVLINIMDYPDIEIIGNIIDFPSLEKEISNDKYL